jgi:hypothetical protein
LSSFGETLCYSINGAKAFSRRPSESSSPFAYETFIQPINPNFDKVLAAIKLTENTHFGTDVGTGVVVVGGGIGVGLVDSQLERVSLEKYASVGVKYVPTKNLIVARPSICVGLHATCRIGRDV